MLGNTDWTDDKTIKAQELIDFLDYSNRERV
jgi:hypothetical protein